MFVPALGGADVAGVQVLDVFLAVEAVVHVHGAVQDDEDFLAVVDVPLVGASLKCRRTVVSPDSSAMSQASQAV